MRILLLDVNCKSGSTGKIVYDLYTQLNKNGHTAAIGYGRGAVVNENNIIKFSSDIEVYIHALLTRITGLTGYFSYFATRRLIKFIDDFKPDVVHLNDMHGYFVNIISLIKYLKEKNIKTVWTFHCEFMYTGKCGHSYECEKWKRECEKCPNVKDYPSSIFLDFTNKMFNDKKAIFSDFKNLIIVTPSKWLADRVNQSFLKNKEVVVIHNGTDTKNIFYPREFSHLKKRHNLNGEKVVLAVAPNIMSEQKGGKFVLELAKKMKNDDVKVIIIGLDNLNEKFDDNIIAIEKTENQIKLAEYYSMSDVFVICSKRETFSMTCVESLACGTPVVGFKAGAPETIVINEYSEFVEYGNVEALVGAIKNALKIDKEERDNLYKIASEKYSKEIMYNEYLKLYFK